MKAHPLLLPVLAFLVLMPAVGAQEKILLRQHWEPGKVYHFETNMDMQMTMAGLPGGGEQSTTVIQQMDVTVRKEAGSERKLAEMKFSAIKAMMNMAGQLMTYDSTDPAMSQPMLQQAFGALLGKSITLIYDKDDKFVDVTVPEGFAPTPLGQVGGPDGKQFATMLRETVDFGLPADGLAVGGTFNHEKKVEMQPLGAVTTKMNGKFDSIVDHEGRKHAKLLTEGTMEIPSGGQAQISVLAGSKLNGETLFDVERKAVSRSTVRSEMKMSVAGKEMPMKQTIVTTLKGIEDAPPAKK